MENFKTVHISDMSVDPLTITGITLEVENDNHQNVLISLNAEKNALGVAVSNTKIRIHVNWRANLRLFSITGVGDIRGTVDNVGMNVSFETQDKEGKLIPKINIQDFTINFDAQSFDFQLDCSACPGNIASLLLNTFRGPLLDRVSNEATSIANSRMAQTLNARILNSYPLTANLSSELSMSLANMGPIVVRSDFIKAKIDGTIFLSQEGYNRPVQAPEIPVENPENPGEAILFISKYMYETLQISLNKVPLSFDTSLWLFALNIKVDGRANPIEISTPNNTLHISGGAVATIPRLGLIYDVAASTNLYFNIYPGDSQNMLFIDPEVNQKTLRLVRFRFTFFGLTLNLSFLTGIANWFISWLISRVVFPVISVPKIDALPLVATSAMLSFYEKYTEAGIAFNFGMDYS